MLFFLKNGDWLYCLGTLDVTGFAERKITRSGREAVRDGMRGFGINTSVSFFSSFVRVCLF
jgi:hypothetical protein